MPLKGALKAMTYPATTTIKALRTDQDLMEGKRLKFRKDKRIRHLKNERTLDEEGICTGDIIHAYRCNYYDFKE